MIPLVIVSFNVEYVDEYPDVLPKLSLSAESGELDDDDLTQLVGELEKVVRMRPRTCICEGRLISGLRRVKRISGWP